MDIGIIRMSSKGQIVIPASMRSGLSEGEQILVIRDGNQFILKPLEDLEPALKDDILFAEKTEHEVLEFEKGKFSKKSGADFIDDLKSW